MIHYASAWSKEEIYQPGLVRPMDQRLHIPDSSTIKTQCGRRVHKVNKAPGNPLLLEVCKTCQNKMREPYRKARIDK